MYLKRLLRLSLLFMLLPVNTAMLFAGAFIPGYEGISGLRQVDSQVSDERARQINTLVQDVYGKVQQDFNRLIAQFIVQVEKDLNAFGKTMNGQITMTSESLDDVHAIFDQNLHTFQQSMDDLSKKALQQYYDGMKIIVGDSYFDQSDPVAKELEQTIATLEHDAIVSMNAMISDIFSPNNLDAIGKQAQQGVQDHEKKARAEYEFLQGKASQERHTTWWGEFTATSTQILNAFETEIIAASQDELKKACQDVVADSLSQGISSVAGLSDEQKLRYKKPLQKVSNQLAGVGVNAALQATASLAKGTSNTISSVNSALGSVVPSPSSIADFSIQLSSMSMTDLMNLNPLYASMMSTLKSTLRNMYPSNQDNSNVFVRTGIALCPQEIAFVKNRMPKIAQALQQNFGVQTPLKIALCCSGGGNRAMLTTLGYSLGLQDIGLFDATLYMAGVSGSTWTISPWSYFYATQEMSLTDFKNQLVPRLDQSAGGVAGVSLPPLPGKYEQITMSRTLPQRFGYDLYLSSIDLYGAFIGNFTMMPAGKESLKVTWSSIASQVEKGDMPLPMGAAVSYIQDQKKSGLTDYYWLEIGPFEAGSDQIGSYVSTKAFGSQFKNGKVVAGYAGQAPEYPISFYEGIYGSAFAFSANEALDRMDLNQSISLFGQSFTIPVNDMIKMATPTVIADTRFYPATLHNYTQGITSSPIAQEDTIRLYDGAMDFNFPLPLVMRPARQVDLVLLCDASNNLIELQNAQIHFKKNGIKFPDLTKYPVDAIENNVVTVLNDPRSADYDKDTATILYCPLVKNSSFSTTFDPVACAKNGVCNTFNFKYSQDQANQVIDLARYNVTSIKDEITAVLKALESKKNQG